MCSGQQLVLKCETNANFLQWNITFPDSGYNDERLITSSGITEITPLKVNNIQFDFTRISEAPLVTTMTISNVTADLIIGCRKLTGQLTSSFSTLILLVRAQEKKGNKLNMSLSRVNNNELCLIKCMELPN